MNETKGRGPGRLHAPERREGHRGLDAGKRSKGGVKKKRALFTGDRVDLRQILEGSRENFARGRG